MATEEWLSDVATAVDSFAEESSDRLGRSGGRLCLVVYGITKWPLATSNRCIATSSFLLLLAMLLFLVAN